MHVLVTGGAGYIGTVLVPKLLAAGHRVTVFDALWFGASGLAAHRDDPGLKIVEADIRDSAAVDGALSGVDAVIHLAAISNDPCSDLDADLTRSVNLDALAHVMRSSKAHGVTRFLYASSASVYGIKETADVVEDLPLEPITLYARYKAEGEEILNGLVDDGFVGVSVRAATVCGYSPRLRLDLTINILTSHAVTNGRIRVFGGSQMRPNIHIEDLTDLYVHLLDAPADKVNGQAFNVSSRNASVMQLAQMIQGVIDPNIPIDIVDTMDHRSYHLSAGKAERVLGFAPKHHLEAAVEGLKAAFGDGRIADPSDVTYRNVAWMKENPGRWRR